jgi:hypothetical protein
MVAHAFAALALAGLVAITWIVSPGRRRRALPLLAGLVPLSLGVGRWLLGSGRSDSHGVFYQVLRERRSLTGFLRLFHDWTVEAYLGRADDIVFYGALAACVLAAVALFRRARAEGEAWSAVAWRPLALLGATLLAFVVLPFELKEPIEWWGVNIRVVPLLWALAIASLPRARAFRSRWLAPVLLLSTWWSLYLVHDFRTWFRAYETAGLDDAVARIPPGKRVLGLFPDYLAEPHYRNSAWWYLPDAYVQRQGGFAYPSICERGLKDSWVACGPLPPHPDWGRATQFDFRAHVPAWDYFLWKRPVPGAPEERNPLLLGPPDAVERVGEFGAWELYRRRGS